MTTLHREEPPLAKSPSPNYADLRGLWLWLLLLANAAGVVGLIASAGTILSRSGRVVGLVALATFSRPGR